jgi:hypothetical protein
MPKAAINALLFLYLLIGSIPAILLMVLPPLLHSNRDFLNDYFLVYLLIVGGWLLMLLFVVRSGRLIGLHLFRSTAFLLTAMLLVELAAAALVAIGMAGDGTHDARLGGAIRHRRVSDLHAGAVAAASCPEACALARSDVCAGRMETARQKQRGVS